MINNNPSRLLVRLTAMAVAVWFLWGLFGVRAIAMLVEWLGKWDPLRVDGGVEKLGQTGDIFGGASALFSALAFVGVLITAHLQQRTFELVEAQQRQQSFEPLFFHLIDLNRKLVPEYIWGEVQFTPIVKNFLKRFSKEQWVVDITPATPLPDIIEKTTAFYYETYNRGEASLGPYFRSLYHVFKLIDSSGLSKDKRIEYADIARAMLSRDELSMMVINCASVHGDDFRRLITKYGILKHLSRTREEDAATLRLAECVYGKTALIDARGREQYWIEHPGERPGDM